MKHDRVGESPFEYVIKRSGARVPFTSQRISNAIYRAAVAVGGRDKAMAKKLTDQVIDYLEIAYPPDHTPTVEEIQDAVEKILIENGHARVAKAYILYRDERARMREMRNQQTIRPSELIPWPKVWQVLDWAVSHEVHTIQRYNDRIERGELQQIVSESEMFYEEDIKLAAQQICENKDQIKLVLISGPSSSGKTTTTIKIGKILSQMGLNLVALNVDNYFFDLEDHPKDEFGDYDFETPQALDLALINRHLIDLIAGKEVLTPFYDFKEGKRHDSQAAVKIGREDIILIDSLHGLYPPMTQDIPDQTKFKIYLEPLLQMKDNQGQYIRWTDIRLLRRMLRDSTFRAFDPEKTLTHWHYVRTGEMRHIIPNHIHADIIINSAMPYELSLYKPRLIASFQTWTEKYKNELLREDAFLRASRVLQFLKTIISLEDDTFVPGDSVIREFIGGSILNYH